MLNPCADMVVPGRKEYLRFVFHSPERVRVHHCGGISEKVPAKIGCIFRPGNGSRPQLFRAQLILKKEIVPVLGRGFVTG
jgi:hypothetical protein